MSQTSTLEPIDTQPADSQPADSQPADSQPADTVSTATGSTLTEPTAPGPTAPQHEAHECGGCGGLSRRAVLAGAGALGAAVTLAACGGGAAGAGGATQGGSTQGGTTPGEQGSDDGDSPATDAPATPGALAKAADVPVGGAIPAQLDGAPVLITQPTAGEFVGISAICTHQGCTVAPDGDHLTCPCHASTFDLAGGVTRGPATEPLVTFAVEVVGEDLVVGQA